MPTNIEWTKRPGTRGETWNPIAAYRGEIRGWFCTHVSEGCRNCYAERQNVAGVRGGNGLPYKPGHRREVDIILSPNWTQPLSWRGPRTIFVCSMTDLFGEWVPDDMIDMIFAVMALCPQHTFIVLTKRPERMRDHLAEVREFPFPLLGQAIRDAFPGGVPWPLPNVWAGVSVEDQPTANKRLPFLIDTRAVLRLVSAEPLLGPIDLTAWLKMAGLDTDRGLSNPGIDWVFTGGESGHRARPMHPDWPESILDQCQATGVPFLHKQNGAFEVVYDRDRTDPDWRRCDEVQRATPNGRWLNLAGGHGFHGERVVRVVPVGKARAGRLLGGREWNEFPG